MASSENLSIACAPTHALAIAVLLEVDTHEIIGKWIFRARAGSATITSPKSWNE